MNNRSQARRRRGKTPIRPIPPRAMPDPLYDRLEKLIDPEAREALDIWREHRADSTFVYFITTWPCDEIGDHVKIGYAADPISRLAELQCGNPNGLYIAALLLGTRELEAYLHAIWSQARVRGEWFGKGHSEAIITHARQAGLHQLKQFADGDSLEAIYSSWPALEATA